MIEISEIEKAICETLEGAIVRVKNPRQDGLHFEAIVVAPDFEGKSLVEQHQQVMGSLKSHFDSSLLHAMSLKTYTETDWKLFSAKENAPDLCSSKQSPVIDKGDAEES